MRKIFVINGGLKFAHSNGTLNHSLSEIDKGYFTANNGFEFRFTDINEAYDIEAEVDNFLWADTVIYHFPAWWMGMPFAQKEYIDRVFTAGHRKGMYYSDGRKSDNPEVNYGKGGLMHGRTYLVTTTWNAPETAFTLPGEFFQQKSIDEGVLFGFHRMHAFVGMEPLESMHFHDVEKNGGAERMTLLLDGYKSHLKKHFRQS